jgi:hypothetical protein
MAEVDRITEALAAELAAQGQGGAPRRIADQLTAYPIKGTIDVVALAVAVEKALFAATADDELDDLSKTPAELNAANDG